jgi:predicted ATP-grasp superfamily ATP-dependent carboligase
LEWPAIVKPVDGAGSLDVQRVSLAKAQRLLDGSQTYCVQAFCPGRAASVAALCGPQQQIPLPPCWQYLDSSSFAYRGGALIHDTAIADRARRLAQRALRVLPVPLGYLGLDLILGPAEDGSTDFLIEINPRLTTSYVGLSMAVTQNLAAALIQVLAGQRVELSFRQDRLEFEATGCVYGGGKAIQKES